MIVELILKRGTEIPQKLNINSLIQMTFQQEITEKIF